MNRRTSNISEEFVNDHPATGDRPDESASLRDPLRYWQQYYMCHAYAHLAQWENSIKWCEITKATNPSLWFSYLDLAAANGWLGRDTEAKAAAADLLRLRPDFNVSDWSKLKFSDNPQFQSEYQRIGEGLRKAGLPEGQEKSN
jgi:adenylate cyclase